MFISQPSRNSFLSGRRPEQTEAWNFLNDFRQAKNGSQWITLPQAFRLNGYTSYGTGKVFHPNLPPQYDPPSWTNDSVQNSDNGKYFNPPMDRCDVGFKRWCAVDCNRNGDDANFTDVFVVHDAMRKMDALAANIVEKPFFLAVGFRKPHLDWRMPLPFLDDYKHSNISLPRYRTLHSSVPPIAYHGVYRSDFEQEQWERFVHFLSEFLLTKS